jgi:hypothetical protein
MSPNPERGIWFRALPDFVTWDSAAGGTRSGVMGAAGGEGAALWNPEATTVI